MHEEEQSKLFKLVFGAADQLLTCCSSSWVLPHWRRRCCAADRDPTGRHRAAGCVWTWWTRSAAPSPSLTLPRSSWSWGGRGGGGERRITERLRKMNKKKIKSRKLTSSEIREKSPLRSVMLLSFLQNQKWSSDSYLYIHEHCKPEVLTAHTAEWRTSDRHKQI